MLRLAVLQASRFQPSHTQVPPISQVTLPAGSLASYNGRNAQHTYKVCAYLDKSGNDPDSGWVTFDVR